jgi:hypothetical protein
MEKGGGWGEEVCADSGRDGREIYGEVMGISGRVYQEKGRKDIALNWC